MPSLREYKEEYALPVNACLNVTNACPLACKYCFVHQNPECMSLEIAQDSVKYLYNNLKRKRELLGNENLKGTINFFGGEPMLMYNEIIVPLVEWTEKTYPNCFSFGITTNGVLLNKKSIDFFYEHNIIPLLSMDGDRETQDYNRPYHNGTGSFDKVVAQIPYLLEKFPNTVFRMTIYEDTCDKFFDNILFAEKMGFKYFFAIPDSRHNFSEENLNKLKIELEKLYLYFVGSLLQGRLPIQSSIIKDTFLLALKEPSLQTETLDRILPRDIIRCGLGTESIGISPKGQIYGCQEQITNTENLFFLGDIYNGINKVRHLNLLNEFRQIHYIQSENSELCKKCNYKTFCYEIECPSMAWQRFNSFFIVPSTLCFWRNQLMSLTKRALQIEHVNIQKYLLSLLEEEEQYELYYLARNRISRSNFCNCGNGT